MTERFVPSGSQSHKTAFHMGSVPEGALHGWKIYLNGNETPTSSLQMRQEKMGIKIDYGYEVYDRPVIKEAGGGGSVIIPYCIQPDGRLYIGVLKEKRDLMGGAVWNVPRGFVIPGEEHFQTAVRQYAEETGHNVQDQRIYPIQGAPTNPNSAFFDTSEENEGVKFYAVELLQSELRAIDDDMQNPQYEFDPEQLVAVSAVAKKIMGTTFIPVEDALRLADQFTVAGVGRLFMELLLSGRIDSAVYAPKK